LVAEYAMSSSSAQQLANFTLLHYDKSTSARASPCFLYLIAECSSLYVAKRALALFLTLFCIMLNFAAFQSCLYFFDFCFCSLRAYNELSNSEGQAIFRNISGVLNGIGRVLILENKFVIVNLDFHVFFLMNIDSMAK